MEEEFLDQVHIVRYGRVQTLGNYVLTQRMVDKHKWVLQEVEFSYSINTI